MYGASWPSFVCAKICRRNSFSGGMPASRARVMLIVGRSSGRPSRLLRSVSVTNSSSSLPTWSDEPIDDRASGLLGRQRAGGATVEVLRWVQERVEQRSRVVASRPRWSGRRRRRASSGRSGRPRAANSAWIAGLMSGVYTWNGRIAGWILRANSSNTRCWYSISVTKRAAWNRRSPFQRRATGAVGSCHSASA